ncbi:MAG: phosphoribosylanthranilate isomerase [Cyclobacteriaceae bacterium]
MSLQTFVKVGEITNLSDARYCAGMGVDLLGFNVVENTDGFVDPAKFAEITGWVVGVDYCAEIKTHQPPEDLLTSLKNAGITYVESSSEEILNSLEGFKKIYKVIANGADDLITLSEVLKDTRTFADFILVESENKEIYESIDQVLIDAVDTPKILKAYGLSEKSVANLNNEVFYGVALKGSEEIKPGYKDFDELAEILEALETD